MGQSAVLTSMWRVLTRNLVFHKRNSLLIILDLYRKIIFLAVMICLFVCTDSRQQVSKLKSSFVSLSMD